MNITRRTLLAAGAAGAAGAATVGTPQARAQTAPIRIGVLDDQSGPYRDITGMTDVAMAKQAVQDFGQHGLTVEIVTADHQNKPDVGAAIARQWIDRDGVSMITSVPNSAVALAVNGVCREKNTIFVDTGAGTTSLTTAQCSPVTFHWGYDVYMLARSTGGALVKSGGDSWYFITADYVFGHQLQDNATRFVTGAGGRVLGSSKYPFPGTTDFSSFLVSAQSSGAKVVGLANAGQDTVNCVKQAKEFGVTPGQRLAALLMYISDVHGIGLADAQGLVLTESYYWDLNDRTRRFAQRVQPTIPGRKPNMTNAGTYAASLHYLKALADIGPAHVKDGAAVAARMKKMPTEDDCFGTAALRADGLFLSPAYLFQVKTPAQSKAPWDYYTLLATTPADQAYAPLDPKCSFGAA
jgi:branched-chain amino acid transport system substrate-binding protein